MTTASRRLAGILLLLVPTVAFGGTSLLRLLVSDPAYAGNALRQDLWRAGHAHAGVLLLLALVLLRYADEARLGRVASAVARHGVPVGAVLLPAAFFLAVLDPAASEPNALIHLAWPGALAVVAGVATTGVGLLRSPTVAPETPAAPRAPARRLDGV
jgi:hypothetical protein